MAVPKSKVSKQRRNKRRSSRYQHLSQVRYRHPAPSRVQKLYELQWP